MRFLKKGRFKQYGCFLVFLYYFVNAFSMARPQYTPEQRNFCVMQYVKNGEGYGVIPKVQTAFGRRFPGVRIPERRSIKAMVDKQNSLLYRPQP